MFCWVILQLYSNFSVLFCFIRQAKAQNELGLFELAKDSTKEALKIEPGNMEVREFHEKVKKIQKAS